MDQTRFDPSESVKFDLGRGRVSMDRASSRVLVPSELLLDLCERAGAEARGDFARRLGTEIGRRVSERIGDTREASIETVLDHLGGDLALLGLGSLGLERWGRALVLTCEGSPFGPKGDSLLGEVLEGAIQRLFGLQAGVVVLERQEDTARLLVLSAARAAVVRAWLSSGVTWADTIARLHENSERKPQ